MKDSVWIQIHDKMRASVDTGSMTMRHFADLLGVPFANVQRWIRKPESPPSISEMERIANILGYDVCLQPANLNWTFSERDDRWYAFAPNGYFVLEKEGDRSWEWHFIVDSEEMQHPQAHYCETKTEAKKECNNLYDKMKKSGFNK